MEPTQGKPVKKRRRWLIVAFVLLLLSTVSWWYWPRIDSRFVGKWTITGEGIWGHVPALEFKSNGLVKSFMYRASENVIQQRNSDRWSVIGGRLILTPPSPSSLEFDQFAEHWIGRLFGGDERRYEIREIGHSTMCLRDTATGVESRYVR